MKESEFHSLADDWLTMAADVLEEADQAGALEADCDGGALTVLLPSGKQLLVSKHTPMRQLWLASPISGGLHFSYDAATGAWRLPDGRTLEAVLAGELKTLAEVAVTW